MRERAGCGGAVQRDVERAAASRLVFAAEVIEVEVAVGAEAVEVRRAAGPGTVGSAAEREGYAVVGAQTLHQAVRDDAPALPSFA